MRRSRLILLVLAVALIGLLVVLAIVGGGGGHSFAGPAKATAPGTIPGQHRPCDPRDFYMQCALRDQPKPKLTYGGTNAGRGVDFAWGAPSCNTFHANGWDVAATYFDTHDMSKGWSRGLVNYFSSCGVSHLAVWESTAGRATNGYGAGVQDARDALWVAGQVGMQPGRPVFFAVDCDCSGGSVAGYFDGVKAVLGVNRTGAYAGYWPTKYLFDTHRIAYGWQTYAWSGGNWDPRARFRQYLNDNSVDFDSHTAGDYGQWPYNAAPPGPSRQQIGKWIKGKKDHRNDFQAHKCGDHPLTSRCVGDRKAVVAFQNRLEQKAGYKHVHCWGSLRKQSEAICIVLRPTLAAWSRARDSSRNQYWSRHCQRTPRRQDCVMFAGRTKYFSGRVNNALTNH